MRVDAMQANHPAIGKAGFAPPLTVGQNAAGAAGPACPLRDCRLNRHALLTLLGVLLGSSLSAAETGYIHRVNYRRGSDGERQVVDQEHRIWFTQEATRHEHWEGGVLATIQVRGYRAWSAYPRIRRWERHEAVAVPFPSFVEVTMASGAAYRKRQRIGAETLLGFPCEKFTWRDPGGLTGDLLRPPDETTVWVWQNDSFPLVLRLESAANLCTDTRTLELDCRVPDHLFEVPANLRGIVPFRLPSTNFSMEFLEVQTSAQYRWSVRTTHRLYGVPEAVRCFTKQIDSDPHGKQTVRTNDTRLSADQLRLKLLFVHPPYWPGVVQQGGEKWCGLEADVYVPDAARRPLAETYWVVDHPVLGTITVKRLRQEHTLDLIHLAIGSNNLDAEGIESGGPPNAVP